MDSVGVFGTCWDDSVWEAENLGVQRDVAFCCCVGVWIEDVLGYWEELAEEGSDDEEVERKEVEEGGEESGEGKFGHIGQLVRGIGRGDFCVT